MVFDEDEEIAKDSRAKDLIRIIFISLYGKDTKSQLM